MCNGFLPNYNFNASLLLRALAIAKNVLVSNRFLVFAHAPFPGTARCVDQRVLLDRNDFCLDTLALVNVALISIFNTVGCFLAF